MSPRSQVSLSLVDPRRDLRPGWPFLDPSNAMRHISRPWPLFRISRISLLAGGSVSFVTRRYVLVGLVLYRYRLIRGLVSDSAGKPCVALTGTARCHPPIPPFHPPSPPGWPVAIRLAPPPSGRRKRASVQAKGSQMAVQLRTEEPAKDSIPAPLGPMEPLAVGDFLLYFQSAQLLRALRLLISSPFSWSHRTHDFLMTIFDPAHSKLVTSYSCSL